MKGKDQTKNNVFICGCSRSGTTTFAELMRVHPKIIMGKERYGVRFRLKKPFSNKLFSRNRFCQELREDDSHHKSLEPYYHHIYENFDTYSYIGDKIPALYSDYSFITKAFNQPKIIFLVRNIIDVSQSFEKRADYTLNHGGVWPTTRRYKSAVDEWNLSLENTLKFQQKNEILVIEYETLYQDIGILKKISQFLDLDASLQMEACWKQQQITNNDLESKRVIKLSSNQKKYISYHARFDLYKKLISNNNNELT